MPELLEYECMKMHNILKREADTARYHEDFDHYGILKETYEICERASFRALNRKLENDYSDLSFELTHLIHVFEELKSFIPECDVALRLEINKFMNFCLKQLEEI